MIKNIVILGIKKGENNLNYSPQISHPQNLSLMSIVDTSEKNLPNFDRKSNMRKVRTSSVKSSSTLFYFSIYAIYNRLNSAKKLLMLNLCLPGINTSIFPKINNDNIFSGKLVNELHAWI